MDIPFDIGKAIGSRRSVRSFRAEPLDPGTLGRLSEFSKALPLPFPCATRTIFFKAEPTLELYTSLRSPPDNVAFASETDIVSLAKTGFAGELVILMAESLGVSTCWFGHYRLAELERLVPDLRGSERPGEARGGFGCPRHAEGSVRAICISPLGYYEKRGLRLMDRITKSAFSSRRKEIRELLEDPEEMANLPEDVLYALDLARKAPSAANAQMWRFGFGDRHRAVRVAMPVGYGHFKWEHPDVDIGICAAHAWLGLVDRGHSPSVEVNEESGRAVFTLHV